MLFSFCSMYMEKFKKLCLTTYKSETIELSFNLSSIEPDKVNKIYIIMLNIKNFLITLIEHGRQNLIIKNLKFIQIGIIIIL